MEEFYHHQQQQQQTNWNARMSDFNSLLNNCDDSFSVQPDPFDNTPTSVPVDPTTQFGTATTPNVSVNNGNRGAIEELMGRLGSDSNGNFHATSLSSQTDPNWAPFDPGFVERAARFSKFGSRSFNEINDVVGNECRIPRVSSCQALRFPSVSPFGERLKVGLSRCDSDTPENDAECSSVSEKVPLPPQNDSKKNSRKRKSNAKGKKEISSFNHEDATDRDKFGAKRTQSEQSDGTQNSGGSKNAEANGTMNDEKKDYIHVRARRGQATDSHSLAERVRREKLSQRMKFLQDLVPGCNKVTGKAVMLDEIINYVQSLQRQVEFLSMKLSTLNPRTDINMEALLSKDLHQARSLLSQSMFALASSSASPTFPYGYETQGPSMKNAQPERCEASFSVNPFNREQQNHGTLFSNMDGFEQSASQVSMWIDELHNVVQMGHDQNEQHNF